MNITMLYPDRDLKSIGLHISSYMLMEAVEHGFIVEAKFVIDKGADVNMMDAVTKKYPLELALEKRNEEMACLLLSNGADIERKFLIHTPLTLAIINGLTDVVAMLIEYGVKINNTEDNMMSALQLAILGGHNTIAKMLVERGANVNRGAHEPPLFMAVRDGYIDVVKTLLDGGAMIDYLDSVNCSVLETALIWGKKDIAKMLIEKGANIDGALDKALQTKSTEIVETLLSKEIDFQYKDKYGKTLFMIAATHGELQLMSDLIDKGSDIEEKDNTGMTALMLASRNCCLKGVEMLIEKGARVNEKSNEGLTALMYASGACINNKEVVKKLIESGSCVKERSNDGSTALMFAVSIGQTDNLKVLIDYCADLNVKRNDGDTALIIATQYQHIQIVEALIDSGADVNVFGNFGLSARQIAVRSEKLKSELLKILEKKPNISKHIVTELEYFSKRVGSCKTSTGPEKNISEEKISTNQSADPLQMLTDLPLDTEEQMKLGENDMEVLSEKLSPILWSPDEIFLSETLQKLSKQLKKRKRTEGRVNKGISRPQAITSYGSKVKCPKVSSRQSLEVKADVMLEECVAKVTRKENKNFTSDVTTNAQLDDEQSDSFFDSCHMDKLLKHKRNLSANKQIAAAHERRKVARKTIGAQQSQRVYVFYFINNVKTANLKNASYVNVMKTRYCVIK